MVRQAGHKHELRIVAHTTDQVGKAVRVLLGCTCSKTEVIRPHQGRKSDPAFYETLAGFKHLCCDELPSLPNEEAA